ncbi:MAG: AAA family ATPase, partial [Bdellovibrionota bacterium]
SPAGPEPVAVPFSQIPSKPPSYLESPRVPRGRLVLLEGDPDTGKTWLCLELAARLSRAEKPGKALYLGSRDRPAGVLRPRLDACGADLSRVLLVAYFDVTLEEKSGERRLDLDKLSALLEKEKPDLLVIDPIDPYTSKKTPWLGMELDDLAAEHGCTVLAVRHLPRTPAGRIVRPRPGDPFFQAGSVLLAAVDPENPQKRLLAHARNAHGPLGETRGFEITDGGVAWGETKEITARELLEPPAAANQQTALEAAKEFLRAFVADRRPSAWRIFEEARHAGIAPITLYRAKKALGIQSAKGYGSWDWEFPKEAREKDELERRRNISKKNDDQVDHLPSSTPEEPLKMNRAERRRMEREAGKLAGRTAREGVRV